MQQLTTTLEQLPMVLNELFQINQVPCLVGPSGIGKTQSIEQVAEANDWMLVPCFLIYRDLVDFRGIPVADLESHTTKWLTPHEFIASSKPKLFFFDEVNNAAPAVQAAAYQITEERRIGEVPLPPDSRVVLAMNRQSDKGVYNRTPMPLIRRMFMLHLAADIKSWCKWAIGANIDPRIVAWARFKPELLYQDSTDDQPAPDPRAWAKLSDFLAITTLPTELQTVVIAGKIGLGAATEFSAFLRLIDKLPSLENIKQDPHGVPVPTDPGARYSVATAIGRAMDRKTIDAYTQYLERMPEDFQVLAFMDAAQRDNKIHSYPAFNSWVRNHKDVFFN